MTRKSSQSPDRRRIHTPIEDRERIMSDQETRYTAFSPRPETRLAMQKTPTTDTKISLNHRFVQGLFLVLPS